MFTNKFNEIKILFLDIDWVLLPIKNYPDWYNVPIHIYNFL